MVTGFRALSALSLAAAPIWLLADGGVAGGGVLVLASIVYLALGLKLDRDFRQHGSQSRRFRWRGS